MGSVATLILAASCIISDPLSHSTGTPIVGTYSEARNSVGVPADPVASTSGTSSAGSAWDARLVYWYDHSGWKMFVSTGLQIVFE